MLAVANMGGAVPLAGDATVGAGGATPIAGGGMAGAGGTTPSMGGAMPTLGGSMPGGSMPSAGGAISGPLPELATFRENPSDRFLVDTATVNDGHLFRGEGAAKPHRGAHVYFDPSAFERYAQSGRVEDLPAVYAVADGVVARVDLSFVQNTGNTRYGLLLDFATRDGERVNMNYSIEPFLNPGDADFYRPFLRVAQGQAVRKGEVIAYVYSSMEAVSAECEGARCTPSGNNAHIHFELNASGHKMSPSIFSADVMAQVHQAMSVSGMRNHDCASGRECEDGAYEACAQAGGLGYALSAAENPFATEAVQCL